MASSADRAQAERKRAARISFRTLRRRATFVGATEEGEPIVQIGEARLVLPAGAADLHRLVTCAKCRHSFAAGTVRDAAHLHDTVAARLCSECATITMPPSDARGAPQLHARPAPLDAPTTAPGPAQGDPNQGPPAVEYEAPDADRSEWLVDSIEAALDARLDPWLESLRQQLTQDVAATVASALGHHDEAHTVGLAALGEQLAEHNRAVPEQLAELRVTIGAERAEQRDALRAELGGALGAWLHEAFGDLVGRLTASVGEQLERHEQALAGQFRQARDQMASRLEATDSTRIGGEVRLLADRLEEQRAHMETRLTEFLARRLEETRDVLSTRLDEAVENAVLAHLDERLERPRDGAGQTP